MTFKTTIISAAITGLCSFSVMAQQDPAVGQWHTIDDKTGEVASLVTIATNEEGKLTGTISKILKKDAGDGLCDKCPEPFTGKPIEGLQFMWGLSKDEPGVWEDGKLMDPETGDVYNGKLEVQNGGKELEVRGYIGISLFGRSQVWQRAEQLEAAENAEK